MGGLGNQLFQIGAAEHIARATGRRLYITDLRSPATGHSSEQYFSNILSAYCSKYKPDIGWNLVIHEREPKFTFEDFTEKIPDDPAIIPCLIGYFQR
jgi:hypothetical protein